MDVAAGNSQLLAVAPQGAAWPPLAAVALAVPQQTPERVRQLAALAYGCQHTAAGPEASNDEAPCQDFQRMSAPLPAVHRAAAAAEALMAESRVAADAALALRRQGQPPSAWLLQRHGAPASPRGLSPEHSAGRRPLERIQSGKEAGTSPCPTPPPQSGCPVQRVAVEESRYSSPFALQLPRKSPLGAESPTCDLQPQRSCSSAGSIEVPRRASCDLGLDYGSVLDLGRRRSLASCV
jgi:hypothetical protein